MLLIILQVIAGISGLYLAQKFVPGVVLQVAPADFWKTLAIIGGAVGLINFFVKPILKAITLPLRIVTLGLFSLVLNMLIIWLVDIFFVELVIAGLVPLFWTTLIISILGWFLGLSKK